MPIVPVYQRRVAASPLPGARVRGGQVGADPVIGEIGRLGGAVSGLGRTMQAVETEEQRMADKQAKVQAEFKQKEDRLYADKAMTELNDWYRGQKPTYTAGQGLEARGSTEQANKDLDAKKNELLGKAQNEEQRALINAAFAPKREVWLNNLKGIEVKKFRDAEVATNQAKIENAIRDASENFDDPLAMQLAKDELRDGINVAIEGMGAEQRKNVTAEYISALHEGVLNNMVTSSAESARAYYDQNKKGVLPEHRDEIEKVLRTEDTLQFAQQKTDEIMTLEDDYEKQLNMARDIKDPEKREAVVNKLKVRKKEHDQLDKEAAREVRLNDLNNILNASDLDVAMDIVNRIDNADDRIKAEKVANNRFEKKTKSNVTDRGVQALVYEKIASGEIKEVRDLIESAPDLSDGDYTRMITELDNKKKAEQGIGTAYIKDSTAKNAFELVKGEKYDVEEHAKEYMYVREGLDRKAQELGRDLTPVEAQQEAAKIIVNGELPGTGIIWSDKLTRQEAEQTGKMGIWLPRINDEDIDNGQELREIQEWSNVNLSVANPSDELMGLIKKEGVLGISLSDAQNARLNKLIVNERNR